MFRITVLASFALVAISCDPAPIDGPADAGTDPGSDPCDATGADQVLCRIFMRGALESDVRTGGVLLADRHAGFTLALAKGERLALELDTTLADPFLQIYEPGTEHKWGARIASVEGRQLANVVAAEAGTHLVVVGTAARGAGEFALTPRVRPPERVDLPPNFYWCVEGTRCRTASVDVTVCPDGNAGCSPARTTTVETTINGEPVGNSAVLVRVPDVATVTSVNGSGSLYGPFVMGRDASRLTLASDLPVKLTYYDVEPSWGGVTRLDFGATSRTHGSGKSVFFRHPAYDPQVTHDALGTVIDRIAGELRDITAVTPPAYRAFLLPTELGIVVGGEGNWAYPDGTITINYGNPDWTAMQGGVAEVVEHEFAHEYTHTIFARIIERFPGNASCLNEGLADALGNFAGYVPDEDFGRGQDGSDFSQGCLASTEIHAKGNCVFWHAKRKGLFTRAFFAALFAPARTLRFDSCDLAAERTGNAYVVYLTEAGGTDASAYLTEAGLPNAGSYAAAKTALGL